MCIYCGTILYRKIYEHHYGIINKDNIGRSYEIHHIDGNHNNNVPENLTSLSICEHFKIHYEQGDYAACLLISNRAQISPDEKSNLARLNALHQLSKGIHPFQQLHVIEKRARVIKEYIDNGSFWLLSGEIQRTYQLQLSSCGNHNFQKPRTYKRTESHQCNLTNSLKHRGPCPDTVKDKIKATYKEKYNTQFINPSSKEWVIYDTITDTTELVVGLNAWIQRHNFNISTVKWSVNKYKKYKYYNISLLNK